MTPSTSELFTCVTCNVAFNDSELQRVHYKTDWHRYNLKRKVAEMPPVSFQDYTDRVLIQKTQAETVKVNEEMFCKLCSKHFGNENAFINHKQSKKHKDLEASFMNSHKKRIGSEKDADDSISSVEEFIVGKSDRNEKKAIQMNEYLKKHEKSLIEEDLEVVEEFDETDKNWEDIGDESIDEFDDKNGVPINDCLFCENKFSSIEDKCEHMAKVHSFFIPDMDHVSDLEGLVKFLGIKLGVYHVCLWCSTKCYRDFQAVSKHMADKGHQKMKFEGETLLEYADFYTFDDEGDDEEDYEILDDSSYCMGESEKSVAIYNNNEPSSLLNDENYELVLPSGARIGHRSLFRYYQQSFGHRNLEIKKQQSLSLRDKYKAIASNGAYNPTETRKQLKDLACFQRWTQKWKAEVGCKANKLQKHFRRQDICF